MPAVSGVYFATMRVAGGDRLPAKLVRLARIETVA